MCSCWSNWWWIIISSNRQQAITGTNDDPVHWCIYTTPDLNTVYSRYITVVYIMELDISLSHVGPTFCGNQEHDIFHEIMVTPWTQFARDNISRNLLTTMAYVPIRRRQFFTKSTQAYLSMRAGTHAVQWSTTLSWELTSPLCHRVGSS